MKGEAFVPGRSNLLSPAETSRPSRSPQGCRLVGKKSERRRTDNLAFGDRRQKDRAFDVGITTILIGTDIANRSRPQGTGRRRGQEQ
jgi:hypothetical protein